MTRRPFKAPNGCMTTAEYAAERDVTPSALARERSSGGGPPWFWWNSETKRRVLYNRGDVQRWVENRPSRNGAAKEKR